MKHIFIINPAAGKGDAEKIYRNRIEKITQIGEIDHEIYLSRPEGQTTQFVRNYCNNQREEELRFYACGGDGTLNEVASGVFGHLHAQVAVVPCGTGNDFIKNFTNPEYFAHIERQIKGGEALIDTISFHAQGEKEEKGIAVNMCNIGVDSETAYRMHRFKKYPMMTGTAAYAASLSSVLLGELGISAKVIFDGEQVIKKAFLLMAAGNGTCYGGGFRATPHAVLTDGLMDVCMVDNLSKLQIAPLIMKYKNGEHTQNKKIAKYLTYRQCKTISIECEKPVRLCIDGEIRDMQKVVFKVIPKSLRISIPAGCQYIRTSHEKPPF